MRKLDQIKIMKVSFYKSTTLFGINQELMGNLTKLCESFHGLSNSLEMNKSYDIFRMIISTE